jgi:hypothetical protein
MSITKLRSRTYGVMKSVSCVVLDLIALAYGTRRTSLLPDSSSALAYGYIYLNSGLPVNKIDSSDPIVSRTIATDRNGNQIAYDFNAQMMLVHQQVFARRSKNSLEASSWETWTKYNSHNQTLLQVMPEATAWNTPTRGRTTPSGSMTFLMRRASG